MLPTLSWGELAYGNLTMLHRRTLGNKNKIFPPNNIYSPHAFQSMKLL